MSGPTQAPREPSAALRQAAKGLREMFVALTAEGFSSAEALAIIGHVLASYGPGAT